MDKLPVVGLFALALCAAQGYADILCYVCEDCADPFDQQPSLLMNCEDYLEITEPPVEIPEPPTVIPTVTTTATTTTTMAEEITTTSPNTEQPQTSTFGDTTTESTTMAADTETPTTTTDSAAETESTTIEVDPLISTTQPQPSVDSSTVTPTIPAETTTSDVTTTTTELITTATEVATSTTEFATTTTENAPTTTENAPTTTENAPITTASTPITTGASTNAPEVLGKIYRFNRTLMSRTAESTTYRCFVNRETVAMDKPVRVSRGCVRKDTAEEAACSMSTRCNMCDTSECNHSVRWIVSTILMLGCVVLAATV